MIGFKTELAAVGAVRPVDGADIDCNNARRIVLIGQRIAQIGDAIDVGICGCLKVHVEIAIGVEIQKGHIVCGGQVHILLRCERTFCTQYDTGLNVIQIGFVCTVQRRQDRGSDGGFKQIITRAVQRAHERRCERNRAGNERGKRRRIQGADIVVKESETRRGILCKGGIRQRGERTGNAARDVVDQVARVDFQVVEGVVNG